MSDDSIPAAHTRREQHPAVSTMALLGFIALSVAVGVSGALTSYEHVGAGGWYAEAAKPEWTPPALWFSPIWTALYLLMSVAAWLVWRRRFELDVRPALAAYFVQLLLNAAWSPVFFSLTAEYGATALWWAFVLLVVLIIAVLFTIFRFWPLHRFAAALLVPYVAWLAFAAALNVWIAANFV